MIGRIGVTVAGTAIGISTAPFAAAGSLIGLTGYGIYRAFGGESKKKK